MHSGVITHENLGDILRGISQRRRQGTLDVVGQSTVSIYFVAGRIVDVIEVGLSPLEEVAQRFIAAGLVPGSFEVSEAETYRELFIKLNEVSSVVDESLFSRVVRHRTLDRLYNLDLGPGAYYVFRVEMVELDKDFSPSISVGQLLLDLVTLRSDDVVSYDNEDHVVMKPRPSHGTLSPEEDTLYSLAMSPSTVDDLQRKSMLSAYHFRDALSSLLARSFIGLRNQADEDEAASTTRDDAADGISIHGDENDLMASEADFGEADDAAALSDVDLFEEPSDRVKVMQNGLGQLTVLSVRLTNVTWIPHLLVACYIALSLCAPIFFWEEVISYFKRN